MSRRFEPSQRPTSGDRRGWVALGLLSAAACAPAPQLGEGFVPAMSFAAAAQNCAALEAVSESICGEETFPVHCWWWNISVDGYTQYFDVTLAPAQTCDAGVEAAIRAAARSGVDCRVDEEPVSAIQCVEGDTGEERDCAPALVCEGVVQ